MFLKVSSIDDNHDDVEMDNTAHQKSNNIGLAFSGGGIRSAAFSSGILRRLLQKQIQVDYMSCVSGGNFTAAAYLDWKYRHGKTDDHKWHHELFENMRSRSGYMCDWSKFYKGLRDTVIIVSTLILVNLVIPIIVWGGLAMPTAYAVDFLFGAILRKGFNCSVPIPQSYPFSNTTRCLSHYDHHYPGVESQLILFVSFLSSYLLTFVLKIIISNSRIIHFLQLLSGPLFGMVFLPWFLQQFFDSIPTWLSILILVLSLFFWCGFPPLRRIASLAGIFYVFAFIVKWRVYRSRCIFIDYNDEYFYKAMLVAGFALWASPYLGTLQSAIIYFVVRWNLQNSFLTDESVGVSGSTCLGFFPILSPVCDFCCNKKKALTMADIADMQPEYISNLEASNWRHSPKAKTSVMIGVGTSKIEIVTKQPGSDKLECPLSPRHIQLADAMTTAAIVTKPPPNQENQFEPWRELLLILGLRASNHVITQPNINQRCSFKKFASIIIQSLIGIPIIFLAVTWLVDFKVSPRFIEGLIVVVFLCYVVVFSIIVMMPTGAKKPWFGESFVRWCQVYLYHVRFLRSFFKIHNNGPRPPAVMSLSDLGILEKYGLLPLLKRRMKKIIVSDGSLIEDDASYANYLFESLKMARELYHCEFTGYDGRDVIGEIHKMYLKHPSGKLPRTYRFLVNYFDKTATGYQKAGQGEVLILAPRHPKNGFDFPTGHKFTWQEYQDDTGIPLDPNHWGAGPVLKSEEVERLTCCCCECCHSNVGCCQSLSRKLFMGFPHHSTANQFFTPQMFSAYHREGYRASIEGDVVGFLTNDVVRIHFRTN